MITELQFFALTDAVRSLSQLRYCLYNLYVEGEFLYVEAKSCDDEQQNTYLSLMQRGIYYDKC